MERVEMSERLDLRDELRRHRYDHAFFCTFGFHAHFFEDFCLEQFDSLEINDNVTVIMDAGEYDTMVEGPASGWATKANVRYLLHPVRPAKRFHPKLFLLASERRGLLVIGSANLTQPGITRNAELVQVFSYEREKKEQWGKLFQQAVSFLNGVATHWPSGELNERIQELMVGAAWLSAPAPDCPAKLLHNLDEPLLPRVTQGIATPVAAFRAVSPFFDPYPSLLDWVAKNLQPTKVEIFTENGAPSLNEDWLDHALLKKPRGRLLFSNWGHEGHVQQLHAKAIAIEAQGQLRLAFGSANFTSAAMLSTRTSGNVELVIQLDDVPVASVDVVGLFDPNGGARVGDLEPSAPREQTVSVASPVVRLLSAALEEDRLELQVESDTASPLEAVLLSNTRDSDGASNVLETTVPLVKSGATWHGTISTEWRRICRDGATIVYARSPGNAVPLTNKVFLLNPQSVSAGSQRSERRIHRAERNAELFAQALVDCIKGGDEAALKVFLTLCDIKLMGDRRGISVPTTPFGTAEHELKQIGERNLRIFSSLHDAAIGFAARHTRRLAKYASRPRLDGVPRCMHLVRSVSLVLATQVKRMIEGLRSVKELDPDLWFALRERLDACMLAYKELMRVVHEEWLVRLAERNAPTVIQAAVQPDLEPLREVIRVFATIRGDVLAVRAGFRVRTRTGSLVEPFIQSSNLIDPTSWNRWRGSTKVHEAELGLAL